MPHFHATRPRSSETAAYDNVASYACFKCKGLHTNFLTWTALRTSVPRSLKAEVLTDEFDPMVLQDAHKVFDIKSAKSKQFYKLLLSKKANRPNMAKRLIADLTLKIRLIKFISCLTMLRVKPMCCPFSTDY